MIPEPPDPNHVTRGQAGSWTVYPATSRPPAEVLYPGAFNPLHSAHLRIAELAGQRTNQRVDFEISLENVDKPPVSNEEIHRRTAAFPAKAIIWLTRAPTFVDKARLFPSCTWLVGADTLARIADPRYYGSVSGRDVALAELADRDCRFLVFGRLIGARFVTLNDLDLPPGLRRRCQTVAPEFRMDISSTELRARMPQGGTRSNGQDCQLENRGP